jgi:hypothetical protein
MAVSYSRDHYIQDAGAPLVRGVNGGLVPVPAFECLGPRIFRHRFMFGLKARRMVMSGDLDLAAMHKKSHARRNDLDHIHVVSEVPDAAA